MLFYLKKAELVIWLEFDMLELIIDVSGSVDISMLSSVMDDVCCRKTSLGVGWLDIVVVVDRVWVLVSTNNMSLGWVILSCCRLRVSLCLDSSIC